MSQNDWLPVDIEAREVDFQNRLVNFFKSVLPQKP